MTHRAIWSGLLAVGVATGGVAGTGGAAAQGGARGVVVLRAEPPAPIAPKTCRRPFGRPDLSLLSFAGRPGRFDKALAQRLKSARTPVVVDIDQPFALDAQASPLLRPWLVQVTSSGGVVTVDEYCKASRGLFSFVKRLFGGGADQRYDRVNGYDAILHVDGDTARVTQVEFRRRTAG